MHIVCSRGKGESVCIKVTCRCLIFIIFGGVIDLFWLINPLRHQVVDLQRVYLVLGHIINENDYMPVVITYSLCIEASGKTI